MKSVKDIKDFMDKYRYMAINPQNTQAVNQFVFDTLIGVTEHLEARAVAVQHLGDVARREAMIEALRWCDETTDHAYGGIAYAIARLENGGDL